MYKLALASAQQQRETNQWDERVSERVSKKRESFCKMWLVGDDGATAVVVAVAVAERGKLYAVLCVHVRLYECDGVSRIVNSLRLKPPTETIFSLSFE